MSELNAFSIVLRILDPEPLTDEEIERHVEWAQENSDNRTFINFHHPLYIGVHIENAEIPEGTSDELREAFDIRQKFRLKHGYIHDRDRTPGQTIIMVERPYRPTAAYILIRRGIFHNDPDGLAEFIMDLWTDTEFPNRNPMWARLWRAFPLMDDPMGDTDLLDPSGTTTVYRGIAVGEEGEFDSESPGMSWTTDRDRAEWFAHRFAGMEDREIPVVLTGQVANRNVLFCYDGRNESEVVSNAVEVTKVDYLQGVRA